MVEEYDVNLHVERTPDDAGINDAPEPFPDHTGARYDGLSMELTVETTPEYKGRVRRRHDVCENACIVGWSVEAGIDITLAKGLRTR